MPGSTVLMPGGRLRWEALSLVGAWGDSLFSRINIWVAFLGAVGFTLETGLTDLTEEEAQVKRAMVEAATMVVAVIDHTKWGRLGSATFCPVDSISRIITDGQAPLAMIEAARKRGVAVDVVYSDDETAAQLLTKVRNVSER